MKSHTSGSSPTMPSTSSISPRSRPAGADQLVDADPAGDRGAAVHLLQRVLEDLAQQPRAVRDAAAVLVGAVVVAAREEVLDHGQPVARVHVHQVVAGPQRAVDALPVPAPQIVDVAAVHAPGLHGIGALHGEVRGAHRRLAAVQVGRDHPRVGQLDPGQRPVLVHPLDQPGVHRDVGVVPDPALDVRRDLAGVVELDLLGADDGPAALRLDAPHLGVRGRVVMPHPVAVRHLEEPVPGRHRSQLHRLEQDIES